MTAGDLAMLDLEAILKCHRLTPATALQLDTSW